MKLKGRRALVLGFRGGVGTALLGLLTDHPMGRALVAELEALFLLDERGGALPERASFAQRLPARTVDASALREVLVAHRIDQLIEVANVSTSQFLQVCEDVGADYVSTSVAADGDAPFNRVMPAARHLLLEHRPSARRSHLIGTGMNPGVVNALVLAGIEAFAQKVGTSADVGALDLYAIYITEQDTTEVTEAANAPEVFASTWCPQHCLEEMLEPEAMLYRGGELVALDHAPHRREYAVRCGAHDVAAMLVPHEEVVSLGHAFPSVEVAFFYGLAPAAKESLARYPDRAIGDWKTRKLYPPEEYQLRGKDKVGVLLCSRRYGELWVGFATDVELGLRYGTNATQLQVAAGLLSGWGMLGTFRGVKVVEELPWRPYLARVEQVLGPRRSHHVPDAPVRSLEERRI